MSTGAPETGLHPQVLHACNKRLRRCQLRNGCQSLASCSQQACTPHGWHQCKVASSVHSSGKATAPQLWPRGDAEESREPLPHRAQPRNQVPLPGASSEGQQLATRAQEQLINPERPGYHAPHLPGLPCHIELQLQPLGAPMAGNVCTWHGNQGTEPAAPTRLGPAGCWEHAGMMPALHEYSCVSPQLKAVCGHVPALQQEACHLSQTDQPRVTPDGAPGSSPGGFLCSCCEQ